MERWRPLGSSIEWGCRNLDIEKKRSLLEHVWFMVPVTMMKDKCDWRYAKYLYTLKAKCAKEKGLPLEFIAPFVTHELAKKKIDGWRQ